MPCDCKPQFVTSQVIFTAVWHQVEHGNHFVLHGNSHVWAMPIYGFWALACEHVYTRMRDDTSLLVRCVLYMLVAFAWEYTTGTVLWALGGACPWDYSSYFAFHVHGRITLEYTPLWMACGVVAEHLMYPFVFSLRRAVKP